MGFHILWLHTAPNRSEWGQRELTLLSFIQQHLFVAGVTVPDYQIVTAPDFTHIPIIKIANKMQHTAVSCDETEEAASMDAFRPDEERFELGEDVYSLIFFSPIRSWSFIFAAYMVALKLTLFTFLATDLYNQSGGQFDEKAPLIRATQFFLLPVAIAMQEDLIHVYTRIANIRYDKKIQEVSPSATEMKFALSFMLRFTDGLYSLIINFVLLLITNEVLSLFLNFAALGFLQSIDDVAFHLAANGYLGDKLEDTCTLVKNSSLPRRVGDAFTNSLDTILFLTTYGVMLAIFLYVIVYERQHPDDGL